MNSRLLVLVSILPACLLGCERSAELVQQQTQAETTAASSPKLVTAAVSPRSTLEECVSAYANLDSYEDQAQVVLRYQMNGQSYEDKAPLSIAWQRKGPLGLRVYSMIAGPSEQRWRLRLKDVHPELAQQVLSRWNPDQVDLPWLLHDQILAESLAAGLGGFPPQLDFLLGTDPLKGLVQSARLAFDLPQNIDGRTCHKILVTQGESQYRLLIDQATMLVRRLELPTARLPLEIQQDATVKNATLMIDFVGIRANEAIDWPKWSVPEKPNDLLVNHFVTPPTPIQTNELGRRVPQFQLRTPEDELNFDSREQTHRATVLLWLADHPASRVAAEQLAAVAAELEQQQIRSKVALLPIWAEPRPPAGETFASLAQNWQLPNKLSLDRDAMGRDLFQIAAAPSLVVLDAQNRIQIIEQGSNPNLHQYLPALLARLCNGEDLATQAIQMASSQRVRFADELAGARTTDGFRGTDSQDPPIGAYEPSTFKLEDHRNWPHAHPSSPAVAGSVDARQSLWILHRDGTLVRRSPSEEDAPLEFKTGTEDLPQAQLLVDESSQYVAVYSTESPTIEIINTKNQSHHSIELPGACSDCQWLTLANDSVPRLAALANQQKITVVNPQTFEQLNGRSRSKAVAIANHRAGLDENHIVLANRELELMLIEPDALPTNKTETLNFQPAPGCWVSHRTGKEAWTLAPGWIARDELGLFLLDAQRKPRWHYRFPLHSKLPSRASVATDPISGLPVWLQKDAGGTFHLLRQDGLTDRFRISGEFSSYSLIVEGSDLLLALVAARETQVFRIRWR